MSDANSSLVNLRDYRIQRKPILGKGTDSEKQASSSDQSSEGKVRKRIVMLSSSETDTDTDSSNTIIRVYKNGFSKAKPEGVLERENQMRYLVETFPKAEAMVIHEVLSRHNFYVDEAACELTSLHPSAKPTGYSIWKLSHTRDYSKSSTVDKNNKRKSSVPNNYNNKRRKYKRENSDDETDDDSVSSNNDFKDTRVFDSDQDSDVEVTNILTSDKRVVLDFMQNATINELQLMSYCSKKKAEAIIESRPFTNWIDLVQKLESNKNLTTDFLNAANQVLITRQNIKNLMKKCTNLAQLLEKAVAAGAGVKHQPRTIPMTLRLTKYQMVGLNWLAVLHAQKVNGILADEMGLGKTVQVIAFLAHLKETGQDLSNHLVIVPSSTLDNWKSEFARWCPNLRVFMYYGSTEERKNFRIEFGKGILSEFDVILTTYTLVGNSPEERKLFRVTPMHYVVFDEAHMLKNMNTQRYENLIRINAKHRILLTGTPLQNNLLELMSLLIFVMPKIFAEKTADLKSLFQKNSKVKNDDNNLPSFEKDQIEQAKRIMKPFVLRRLKEDVLQDLPKKTDLVMNVSMAPTQKEQYQKLVESYQNVSNDGVSEVYNGMSIMTDLRKLSNHPLLLRYHYDYEQLRAIAKILAKEKTYKDTNEDYIVQDLLYMSDFDINKLTKHYSLLSRYELPENLLLTSGKFLKLDKLLPELKEQGHRVLIFSQFVIMLNILEEYVKLRKHSYLRLDGSTPVNERQHLIDKYTKNKDIFIFLLSTRAGGLGINLTSADSVIIHDIDFNPYNDKQAEDRCHRMGQTKPVTVYRFISQGTIEEAMWQMNIEKLKLEKEITTEESENPDVKSVVRLLSSALGIDAAKATAIVSTKKMP